MVNSDRVWFVTGVSSGLGKAIAEVALRQGCRVIGTLRKIEQFDAFDALAPGRAIPCLLDVAEATELDGAVERVVASTGRIDVLVNNAGYGLLGALEEIEDGELRHQMETNFFGAVGLIRAVLPYMRRAGTGHILNISSMAGFQASPGLAIYTASKHALTGLSAALASELKPLGISVTSVEPGAFRTRWAGDSMNRTSRRIAGYESSAGFVRAALERMDCRQPGDPNKAAEAIVQLVDADEPPVHFVLGPDAVAALREQITFRERELDRWEKLSRVTDFP